MKKAGLVIVVLLSVCLIFSVAFAKHHTPEERGKTLFNDPKFAGGSKACSSCHPNGKGLENAGAKKQFHIMGGTQNSLEEAVNACIVNANKGKAIDPKSEQMKDMAAYIKSLGKGSSKPKASGY